MEAQVKKDIYVIESEDAKKVFEDNKGDGKIAVVDFTNSVVIFPNPNIVVKKYKPTKTDVAFSQIKRWISSEAFSQIFLLGGLDCLDKNLIYDWLYDHKSKQGFPDLYVSGKKMEAFWLDLEIIKK
ncbi:MAG: hypothetical protein ACPKM0_10005 [Pleomorphochaeta sp.]